MPDCGCTKSAKRKYQNTVYYVTNTVPINYKVFQISVVLVQTCTLLPTLPRPLPSQFLSDVAAMNLPP